MSKHRCVCTAKAINMQNIRRDKQQHSSETFYMPINQI